MEKENEILALVALPDRALRRARQWWRVEAEWLADPRPPRVGYYKADSCSDAIDVAQAAGLGPDIFKYRWGAIPVLVLDVSDLPTETALYDIRGIHRIIAPEGWEIPPDCDRHVLKVTWRDAMDLGGFVSGRIEAGYDVEFVADPRDPVPS